MTIVRAVAVGAALCCVLGGCGSGSQSTNDTRASTAHSADSPSAGLFSGEQPWTIEVSGAAPSDRSDAIIQTLSDMGGWGTANQLQIDFSIPIFFADGNTPHKQVIGTDPYCFDGPDCDEVPAEMPVPANASVEGSPDLTCDSSGETEGQGDCHLLVVDKNDHKLYETYHATQDGENIQAEGFFVWDLTKDYPPTLRGLQCTSADAAGFPIAALTPTADEVASGAIDHAIRFVLPNDRMKAGVFVAPATHAGGPDSAEPDAPPYGVRFRLKADFDESAFSDSQKVVLRALKTYGMLLSDGGQVPLTFADDRTSTAKWSDLGIDAQSMTMLTPDQFEVVELGPEIELTYDCVRNS
jgi:hypothetical protein